MTRGSAPLILAAALLAACSPSANPDAAPPSEASPTSAVGFRSAPVYLALGDSVPFGWKDALASCGEPWCYSGYPQYFAWIHGLRLLDAACPSEASGSFLSAEAPDDGCRAYRAAHALHVQYGGTQLEYALEVVKTTPGLALVTVQLGANDLQLLGKGCLGDPACIAAGASATVQQAAANVATIVGTLRAAGYAGPIAVMDYYNPSADPLQGQLLQALRQALEQAAVATGVELVDLLEPFAVVAEEVGGDPCATGLIARVNGACEIHPSVLGHLYIAMLLGREVGASR